MDRNEHLKGTKVEATLLRGHISLIEGPISKKYELKDMDNIFLLFSMVHCSALCLLGLDFTGSHRSVFEFASHLLSDVPSCLTGVIFMSDKTVPDLNDIGGDVSRY